EWINQHSCADLSKLEERPAGHIYFCDLTMLAVSSTIIRDKVKCGDSIRYMAPDGVVNYIQQHRLYE
ncbi:MAG: nicotinate-nucleotide adenylyltransferase, partial [Porticoccaceae bacterium]